MIFVLLGCSSVRPNVTHAPATSTAGESSARSAQVEASEGESLEAQVEMFQPILAQPSYTHCNDEVLGPVEGHRSPYPAATPPRCSVNRHGQTERLDGVEMTHHFVDAGGMTFHFVTAGNRDNPAVLLVHGLPESWYGFHHQVAALSDDYYVIAIDMPGYGQSDKRLELDHSFSGHARYVGALLDTLGVTDFFLATHDRGSVLGENLIGTVPGMQQRVQRWVRMQQSANEPHGYPRPPHALFADPEYGPRVLKADGVLAVSYDANANPPYIARDLSEEHMARLKFEWHYEGIAEAVSANFQTSNFDIEFERRMGDDGLVHRMTMPILFLQGEVDPGQKPEEYKNSAEVYPNDQNEVVILEGAGHFTASEQPAIVSAYIRTFFEGERL